MEADIKAILVLHLQLGFKFSTDGTFCVCQIICRYSRLDVVTERWLIITLLYLWLILTLISTHASRDFFLSEIVHRPNSGQFKTRQVGDTQVESAASNASFTGRRLVEIAA